MIFFRKATFAAQPMKRVELELRAEGYLHDLYPDNLLRPVALDVRRFMDKLDDYFRVDFAVEDLQPGEEGYTDPVERKVVVDTKVYRAMLAGNGRARHTCCHEVDHIAHIGQVSQIIRDGGPNLARRLDVVAEIFRCPEWQANGVAGALLMPRSTAPAVYRAGGFQAMVDTFQVSYAAAQYRVNILTKLGAIR